APATMRAADAHVVRAADAHPALVVMLTLTQLAVGCFAAATAVPNARGLAGAGVVALVAGMSASLLHLGRPTKAWRAVLGLRTSWLSREIVGFGTLAPLAALYAGSLV